MVHALTMRVVIIDGNKKQTNANRCVYICVYICVLCAFSHTRRTIRMEKEMESLKQLISIEQKIQKIKEKSMFVCLFARFVFIVTSVVLVA